MNDPLNNTRNRIKLSICITTRNRAELIGQTLDSICSQVTDEVEIVIVDGASTDNTEQVIHSYQEKFTKLEYQRKTINSGIDGGLNASVEAAKGEYCWLMSDDDVIKLGAVQTVLKAAEKGYSVIILNAEDWNADFTVRTGTELGRLSMDTDRVYTQQENSRLFVDTAHHITFIPAIVIRRDLWLSRERERYFGSWFAHVGVVFQSPLPGKALVIANPLVSVRNGNVSWGSKMFEIWLIKWPELIWSLQHFTNECKQRICPEDPSKNWKTLLSYRAAKAYSIKEYRKFILPKTSKMTLRIIPLLISIFPVFIINLLSSMYRYFSSILK